MLTKHSRPSPIGRSLAAGALLGALSITASAALSGCEDAGDEIEDVGEDVGDTVEDAADKTEDAIDDIGDNDSVG